MSWLERDNHYFLNDPLDGLCNIVPNFIAKFRALLTDFEQTKTHIELPKQCFKENLV